jgi:peptidoglycan/LPS O-acetylase OafA/YrhL
MTADTGISPIAATGFRPDVEGLRGIAVVLVVLFHCGVLGFTGGFVGVDVFFALSGYLITNLIVNEIERNGTLSFRGFYARRVRRLLPASGLVAVATLLLGFAVYSPLEQAAHASIARYTLAYISNYLFMRDAADYFARDVATNPYLHTWSLAVEEQFYLFWPAVIALALRRTGTRRRVALLLSAICIISFGLCVWWTPIRQPWAFFGSPARAWEFGLGGLASLLGKSALSANTKWMRRLGWMGLAAIVTAGCRYSTEMSFPGYAAILPVVGTIVVLLSGASGSGSSLQRFLGNEVLLRLGKLSYSWYLWHWPILMLAAVRFPNITWHGKLAAAGLALSLAELTFRLLENPIRFNKFLVARPVLSLSLALFIPVAGLTATRFAEHWSFASLASAEQSRFRAASVDASQLVKIDCVSHVGLTALVECGFGAHESGTQLVLVGDSHAEHWFPAFERVASEKHWELITLIKLACPLARVDIYSAALERTDTECSSWREAALARIAQLHPSAVFISESAGYVAGYGRDIEHGHLLTSEQWSNGIRSTLQYLNSHGLRTIVLSDVPRAGFNVPFCLSRAAVHRWAAPSCLLQRVTSLNGDVRQAETSAADGLRNVRVLDLSDDFCSSSVCPPVIGGQVVYRDNNHLTATFARTLAPELALRVVPLVER